MTSKFISDLPDAPALTGPEMFELELGSLSQKATVSQLLAYLLSALGSSAQLASDGDVMLSANSDTRLPTQRAVKAYVASLVTGLLRFKSSTDCSANPNFPAAAKGDAYIVSSPGKIGGTAGTPVDIGDLYVANADNAGGTQAAVGTSWFVLEHNLVGVLLSANNLADLGNVVAARANLGLGSMAQQSASAVAIAGGSITGVPGLFYESSYAATGTPTGFLNATLKSQRTEIVASGTVDIYTVPVGKKAVVQVATISNTTASTSITYQIRVKIAGTYYPLTALTALAGQALTTIAGATLVLEAGESLSFLTDNGGITLYPQIIEFDAASLWRSARLLSIASGDNVLYTAPPGKTVYLQPAVFGAKTASGFAYVGNTSAGNITATSYGAAGGVTTSSATARLSSATIAPQGMTSIAVPPVLGSGESVIISSSAAVPGGFAWATYQAAP